MGESFRQHVPASSPLTSFLRTVSAYFANGSFIDIGKVEGGEIYKAFMLDPKQKFTKTAITTARYCPLPKELCQHWPFQSIGVQDRNPLASMLKALFAAAEVGLETDVRSAVVAAYAMGDRDIGQAHLNSASSELGVNTYGRIFRAIEQLVPALNLEGECHNPDLYPGDPEHRVEEKLFLTIEYTRSSMTVAILFQRCDYFEILSRVRAKDVGYDAMEACRNAAGDNEICDAMLQNALRKMVRDSSTSGRKQRLGAVLVFGDKALDGNFATALRKALDDDFSNGASITPASINDFSPNLAFAGSRAMAMFELQNKEWRRELAEEDKVQLGEL